MGSSLITRRFVRIKALQHLYAYTIFRQAHKKKASSFDGKGISNVEQSDNLLYYEEACRQSQQLLQGGLNQSKACIYTDYLYILLLLVEWHKMAKAEAATGKLAGHFLKEQLAANPILETLYHNSSWINSIHTKCVSWAIAQDRVHDWYAQLMPSAALPKKLIATLPTNSVKFLEYMVQTIIFRNAQVEDFFAMIDIYWDAHKPIVKKIFMQTLMLVEAKAFDLFTLFWHTLEAKWREEAAFYNRLVQVTLENGSMYERMIGEKAEKWSSERILLIDKLILKLALTEVRSFDEIPIKVSINEYVEIAKLYGTAKSSSFVNGLLEAMLKRELAIQKKEDISSITT